MRKCTTGLPLPTTPRQCGSVPKEFHCPLPPCSVVVYHSTSTAHCPKAVQQRTAGGPPPLPLGAVTVYRGSLNALCPQAMRQCTTAFPLPCPYAVRQSTSRASLLVAPRQCGSVLLEFHCPLPRGSVAVYYRSSTAPHWPLPSINTAVYDSSSNALYPEVVRQCAVGVPLPTTPR